MIQVRKDNKSMDKKKRIITMIVMLGLLVHFFIYLQWGRDMDVLNSSATDLYNFREEKISVVLNKLFVTDKEAFAKEIIKKCRENSFKSILFAHDLAKPDALYVTVYLSEDSMQSGRSIFEFSYILEDDRHGLYNIVDNPEHFTLKLQ